ITGPREAAIAGQPARRRLEREPLFSPLHAVRAERRDGSLEDCTRTLEHLRGPGQERADEAITRGVGLDRRLDRAQPRLEPRDVAHQKRAQHLALALAPRLLAH